MFSLYVFILAVLVLMALFTIMTTSLLRAGLGLALTSAVLTVLMFILNTPLAAVFELSVCAGLIPVIFITVITLTKPLKKLEAEESAKEKFHRFRYLPLIVLFLFVLFVALNIKLNIALPNVEMEPDARQIIWNVRRMDLIGQVMVLLTGAFGILVLFREIRKR